MKRFFDLSFALILLGVFSIPMVLITMLVICSSKGPAFYWSRRNGKDNVIFSMPKFRTMKPDSPSLATHLLTDPDNFVTPIGKFLRKLSLDELPQIYSIIKGDMSFIGPRPALYNQNDLIDLRNQFGINLSLPGLTGWAQVNGRDELTIEEKVKLELEYAENKSIFFDIKILLMTLSRVVKSKGISH